MEIERKFKLKNLPIEINNCEKKEIEQGYLCIKHILIEKKEKG